MELLLLLTALLASLTGVATGERVGARQVPGVAVVQAAEAVQAAVQPSRVIAGVPVSPEMHSLPPTMPRLAVLPVAQGRATPERLLE